MKTIDTAPKVPLSQFKRTKIIATVGPATDSYEKIVELIQAGVNCLRLNFSHGSHEERVIQIKWIRKASKAIGKPVAIIQDLHGPKVQLGDFEGVFTVQPDQQITLEYKADFAKSGHLPTLIDLAKFVKRGERVLLFDGRIKTKVVSVGKGVVHVKAENDGILIKGKGINLPDTNMGGDIITARDRKDLAFGSTQDFDYVAVSFIQTADDIRAFKRILKNLGSSAKIIAKIETAAAVENIEEITIESDAVMVARGDLATDVDPEVVPIVQRRIVSLGLQYSKPTIVATQMLLSMTERPDPTRAEVSDVATAVIVGADCVMLSEETAVGKYPIETVQVMKRVIMYTQNNAPLRPVFNYPVDMSKQSAIANAIIKLSVDINADAIVAETASGATALMIASRRPDVPIIVVTPSDRVAQQLAMVYGTKSFVRKDDKLQAEKLTNWLQKQTVLKKGDIIVSASGQHPGVVGTTDTIKVRILE